MALAAGTRLGPYEVIELIGAGGMGEVYRARDPKLNRDVALKVLPETFAADPERLARFRREAQTLASLNHPHIAAIHGLEETQGTIALVLEFVEGPTVADRIAQGPLPMDEVLPIARQIADALETAHELSIVHRDLKPANVKVRADGTVKVLDFGLAKLVNPGDASDLLRGSAGQPGFSASPTLTSPAAVTGAGMLLGTAAYMAPEQARGKAVDRRADIWAFGVVSYEMLSGRRAFDGETISDVLAKVIEREPDWTTLPALISPRLTELLRRCLTKDPKARLQAIGEARIRIDELTSGARAEEGKTTAPPVPLWSRLLPWTLTGVLGLALIAVLGLWTPWRKPPSVPPQRWNLDLSGDGVSVNTGGMDNLALSADGTTVALVGRIGEGRNQLHIRRHDELQSVSLAGTNNPSSPFFSPDGKWLAFFANRQLKKVPVNGGDVVPLAEAPQSGGGWWSEDGLIVFAPDEQGPIFRIPSAGGTPERVTTLADGEVLHRWPQMLPGGRAILYTAHDRSGGSDSANLVVQTLPVGTRSVVQLGGYHGRYVQTGHLLYAREGKLFARAFDPDRLQSIGDEVPVVQEAHVNSGNSSAQFAVSETGTLLYRRGQADRLSPLLWMNQDGTTSPLIPSLKHYGGLFSFSPLADRIAVGIWDGKQWGTWVHDLKGESLAPLIHPAGDIQPMWTPDGKHIVFASRRRGDGRLRVYSQEADRLSEPQLLAEGSYDLWPWSWDPSGTHLTIQEDTGNRQTKSDVLVLTMEGADKSSWKPGSLTRFINSENDETVPMFSPDGKWVAYVSDLTKRKEVYVQSFPQRGPPIPISVNGGDFPMWVGRELFFLGANRRIMVTTYTVTDTTFQRTTPRPWSDQPITNVPVGPGFAMDRDGKRAIVTGERASQPEPIVVSLNFFDELRRLVPGARH